jgi:hypothetical protein
MRRVKETVPLEECKRRALLHLAKIDIRSLESAAFIAQSIWPDAKFLTGQGAGAAASRILRKMKDDGTAVWTSTDQNWGYKLTSKGRALAKSWRSLTTEAIEERRYRIEEREV